MKKVIIGIGLLIVGTLIGMIGGSEVYNFGTILGGIGIVVIIIGIITGIRNFFGRPSGSYSSAVEGANDLFIELNKGSALTISDGYILGPNGYKLGSINGSSVSSRGKQIGTITGNEIHSMNGTVICHIDGDRLIK